MIRLIDADKLASRMNQHYNATVMSTCATMDECLARRSEICTCQRIISEEPTVDAVPVVHGEWIPHDKIVDAKHKVAIYGFGYAQCSCCKEVVWLAKTKTSEMNYCPNCDAKMDEERRADNGNV